MNIAVIGSCTDSSNLAKELNKRLSNSIVARVDMLKNIKNLVLQQIGVGNPENVGAYIGDVESRDYSKFNEDQMTFLKNTLKIIHDNIKELGKITINTKRPNDFESSFDALTKSFPPGTYSFIKIYSGIIEDDCSLVNDTSFIKNTVFVYIKNPQTPLLPITISEKVVNNIKENAFSFIECKDITDFFNSDVYGLLLESNAVNKEEEKVEDVKKEVSENTTTFTLQDLDNAVNELAMPMAA